MLSDLEICDPVFNHVTVMRWLVYGCCSRRNYYRIERTDEQPYMNRKIFLFRYLQSLDDTAGWAAVFLLS